MSKETMEDRLYEENFLENYVEYNGYDGLRKLISNEIKREREELKKEYSELTEEKLRENDGYLHLGTGCVVVTKDYFEGQREEFIKALESIFFDPYFNATTAQRKLKNQIEDLIQKYEKT